MSNLLKPKVSVSVVSCARYDLLRSCLQSVASQSHPVLECFIWLNSSKKQEAVSFSRTFGPSFIFDFSEDNELYCKPHNSAIARSKGEFILCLNDDVFLSDSYVSSALQAFLRDPRVGLVAGCLLRPQGEAYDSTGLFLSLSRRARDRGYGQKREGRSFPEGRIFGVNGAAMFLRRSMLEETRQQNGYFDENYGIFYEDLDLSWRARRAGWKAWYAPDAIAYHHRGSTTRSGRAGLKAPFLDFAMDRLPQDLKLRLILNRYATMIKNDQPIPFLFCLLFILSFDLKVLFYLLIFDRKTLLVLVRKLPGLRIFLKGRL